MKPGNDAVPLLDESVPAGTGLPPWQVLVVDDDEVMHSVTRLCYADFSYRGRALDILTAHSASEARALLASHPDVALVLLDVVMESEHAGLELARHIREELGNRTVRIVLRTGQPGQAPPRAVVRQYEIDDYRTKTELTFERLHVLTVTALRTYQLLRDQAARERELAHYSEELERFNYAASHDLQTPLRTIVRFAQRLQEKFGGQLGGDAEAYLGFIVQGARDLHALMEDLLAFTALGAAPRPHARVALADVVRNATARLADVIAARHATIDVGPLPAVNGDAEQLEQLFVQLIDNAVKFQPGEAPVVSIAAIAADQRCEVRISDRGIGIEAQYLARVFEPFRRLNPLGTFAGTGIGLAMCRKIARLHGGDIRVQSVPGTGTTVVVEFPAAPAPK